MQQSVRPPVSCVDRVQPVATPAAGPVPIDLQLLKLVAGGSSDGSTTDVTEMSPKGGW